MARMTPGSVTAERGSRYPGGPESGRDGGLDGDDPDFDPEDDFDRFELARPSLVLPRGEPGYEEDPASGVVEIGERPQVDAPVKVRGHLLPPMPTDAARAWIVTAVLTLIGGVLRFWQLGWRTDGGTPLFDEKYYAVQAAEMIRTGGVEDNQAFGVIVHPPLGKQIIAIGEMIFGYDPVGWRFASAVCGTVCILLIIRATRRLTRSTLLGAIAGVLLICDSVSQVMSHTALLDTILTPFVLGAFACLLRDRDQVRERLALAVADGSMARFTGGTPLGARWWRFGCGFLLGCATAVKWNGAYWVVGFAILSVIWDISARRQFGVRHPITAVVRRDLAPSVWSLAIVPVLTYLASYWAWFTNETGWDRHVSDNGNGVVGALKSLVTMTVLMLKTTDSIVTPADPAKRHPWESKPWSWPLSTRPVLYYLSGGQGTTGCGAGQDDCVKRILLVGTPMLWWVSVVVLAWALWKAFGRLDWRYAAILVGYGSGYLPWFTIFDRQMYFFYMTPVAPFLVMGITLVLGDVLGKAAGPRRVRKKVPVGAGLEAAPESDSADAASVSAAAGGSGDRGDAAARFEYDDDAGEAAAPVSPAARVPWPRRAWATMRSWDPRTVRLVIVSAYIGLVAANFVWMWPILMGDPITPQRLIWETWLPSWG